MRHRTRRRAKLPAGVLDGTASEDAYINLYPVHSPGSSPFLATYAPHDFSIENVAYQYGGGRYRYVEVKRGHCVRKGGVEIDENRTCSSIPREEYRGKDR